MSNYMTTKGFALNYVNRIIDTGLINVREKIAIHSLKEKNTFFERNCKQNLISYIQEIENYNYYCKPSYYEKLLNKHNEWKYLIRINDLPKPKLINYY